MHFQRVVPDGPFLLGAEPGFPDPSLADSDGLLAVGGDLSPERILAAYRRGIFPWFERHQPILWWSPDPRCCFRPSEAHISRSLAKVLRQGRFQIRVDTAFDRVIRACARTRRRGQRGTWITEDMQAAYGLLHRLGWAHSVEAWRGGRLVGGLYGLALGAAFFGESMFSLEADASKACFAALVQALQAAGFTLVDCQVENPHTATLGARPVGRAEFLERLEEGLAVEERWSTAAHSMGSRP